MKTLILLLVLLLFVPIKSVLAQADWIQINSGITEDNLEDIQFVNINTGFVVGTRGIVLKTTNSGLTWEQKSTPLSSNLIAVWFMDAQIGLAVGDLGRIIRTANSGETWNLMISPVTESLVDICFVNTLTGYVSGRNATLIKTTDGGVNWIKKGGTELGYYSACHFFNATNGLVTHSSYNIRETTNSGENWVNIYSPSETLFDLCFINQTTGFASASSGLIIKTTNSGNNWNIVQSVGQGYRIYKMCFASDSLGYAVGKMSSDNSGVIIRTINRGDAWTVESSTPAGLMSVAYNKNGHIFAVGDSGRIYRTLYPIEIKNISTEIPSEFLLKQNYPNPFNPSTNIKFDLPKSSSVNLVIFDALGREVATLVNEKLQPGTYEVDWDGSDYPSGVYFYKLNTGEFSDTKKMLMIK